MLQSCFCERQLFSEHNIVVALHDDFRVGHPPPLDDFVWDNSTGGGVHPDPGRGGRHPFFLVGMAFVGGLAAGFLLNVLYNCIIRTFLTGLDGWGDEAARGVVNMSFVSDEGQPPANDDPPDYTSVVPDAPGRLPDDAGFLKRLFKRTRSTGEVAAPAEEPPPNYSFAVAMLQQDLSRTEEQTCAPP